MRITKKHQKKKGRTLASPGSNRKCRPSEQQGYLADDSSIRKPPFFKIDDLNQVPKKQILDERLSHFSVVKAIEMQAKRRRRNSLDTEDEAEKNRQRMDALRRKLENIIGDPCTEQVLLVLASGELRAAELARYLGWTPCRLSRRIKRWHRYIECLW